MLAKLASLEEWQNNITPHLGDDASKFDTPPASSIPHIKHIENEIAKVRAELAALESPPSKN